MPMVFEAHSGAVSGSVRAVLSWISIKASAISGESSASHNLRVAQRISCTLHTENAQAILRRSVAKDFWTAPSSWGTLARANRRGLGGSFGVRFRLIRVAIGLPAPSRSLQCGLADKHGFVQSCLLATQCGISVA